MKQYIKDGIIKPRNQIVLHGTRTIKDKNGNDKEVQTQIINPKEEMLFNDGWVEFVAPVVECTIEDYRKEKIDEILMHDSSSIVNIFYVNDMPMWLDKATRAGLVGRLSAEINAGKATTTLWYEIHKFELPTELAMQLLNAIEIYASECYDNTQQHIANVTMLESIEEIETYDFHVGYPEYLRFNL